MCRLCTDINSLKECPNTKTACLLMEEISFIKTCTHSDLLSIKSKLQTVYLALDSCAFHYFMLFSTQLLFLSQKLLFLCLSHLFSIYIYIFMHLADAFIQSDLQCIQAIHLSCQYACSLGIEPTTFALLTQCSTTEPQEHYLHLSSIYFLSFSPESKLTFLHTCQSK